MEIAEEFCENYLVVNAKEASLYNIVCILICSSGFLNNKDFYNERYEDAKRSTRENLSRRWLIFVSVLAQKLLIWAKKPMAQIGSLIEIWLNLLSCNGGVFGLMINCLRG